MIHLYGHTSNNSIIEYWDLIIPLQYPPIKNWIEFHDHSLGHKKKKKKGYDHCLKCCPKAESKEKSGPNLSIFINNLSFTTE